MHGVSQSLAYYVALKQAGVPAERHLYAEVATRSVCARVHCRSRNGRMWWKPGWERSACWMRPTRTERDRAQAC
ncbi:UNVERIFIED_ORG: hypothetical protein FHR68_002492 [Xanthomonas campestris]